MAETKIVFTGSVGAGKTAAIGAVSEIPVVTTEAKASDDVAREKKTTTVALDYGEISLGDNQVVKLYGTPGQRRFSYMWEILIRGALGLIILVDCRRENPQTDLTMYMENFQPFIDKYSIVVGLTHSEGRREVADQLTRYIHDKGFMLPVFPIDARNSDEVKVLIESLVAMLQASQVMPADS